MRVSSGREMSIPGIVRDTVRKAPLFAAKKRGDSVKGISSGSKIFFAIARILSLGFTVSAFIPVSYTHLTLPTKRIV